MKTYFFRLMVFLVPVLQFICCEDHFPGRYALELPQPPAAWTSLLGEPHWRVEWLSEGGKRSADVKPGGSIDVEIPVTWANPVSALPYWPVHNLPPGLFKPAGALFPYDVSGGCLRLSWEAGVDAAFYWELVAAFSGNVSRIPANFDWPRFREVLKSEILKEEVREDPWVVDWRSVAEKTVSSTFYQSRLSAQTCESVSIQVSAGPWHGVSPFVKPLFFAAGETPSFPVKAGVNVWVSQDGILRVSGKTWVFQEFDRAVSSCIASRSLSIIDSMCP